MENAGQCSGYIQNSEMELREELRGIEEKKKRDASTFQMERDVYIPDVIDSNREHVGVARPRRVWHNQAGAGMIVCDYL